MDSMQAHYIHVMLKQYYVLTTCVAADNPNPEILNVLSKRKSAIVHVFSECIAALISIYDNTTVLKETISTILKNQNAAIKIDFYHNPTVPDVRALELYNALTNYFQPIKAELLYQISSFIDVDIFQPMPLGFTTNAIFLLNFLETIFTCTLTNDVMGLPVLLPCNSL
jgi:hypothetical protein